MSSYRDAIKEAFATAQSDVALLETIELTHPELAEPIRLVANSTDLKAQIETNQVVVFKRCAFKFRLPAAGENGHQTLTLTLDNVDRQISQFVRHAAGYHEPITVIYRPYLSNDLTYPQMDPPLMLTLSSVSMNLYQVVGKAVFADVINKKFLNQLYTRERFPSLGNWA